MFRKNFRARGSSASNTKCVRYAKKQRKNKAPGGISPTGSSKCVDWDYCSEVPLRTSPGTTTGPVVISRCSVSEEETAIIFAAFLFQMRFLPIVFRHMPNRQF